MPATTRLLPQDFALERPRVGIRSIAVVTLSYRNLVLSGDVVTTATENGRRKASGVAEIAHEADFNY